jgi:hypothetical protein
LRLAHLCTPCTDHPCSNCSENLPGCSFQRLFFKYASRTSVLLLSKKWRLFQVLFLDFCQNCPPSHFMHRNATAVYMDFCHILHLGDPQPSPLSALRLWNLKGMVSLHLSAMVTTTPREHHNFFCARPSFTPLDSTSDLTSCVQDESCLSFYGVPALSRMLCALRLKRQHCPTATNFQTPG